MKDKVLVTQIPFLDFYNGEASALLETPELDEALKEGWQIQKIEFNVLNLVNKGVPSHLLINAWLRLDGE